MLVDHLHVSLMSHTSVFLLITLQFMQKLPPSDLQGNNGYMYVMSCQYMITISNLKAFIIRLVVAIFLKKISM